MSGSVKLGPSKISWKISFGRDDTGHCAPLPLLPVPTVHASVNRLHAGKPLTSSPEWMRHIEVANDVFLARFVWKVVGSIGRASVPGIVSGVIDSVPAASATERL